MDEIPSVIHMPAEGVTKLTDQNDKLTLIF
jgi:hypothetical protein